MRPLNSSWSSLQSTLRSLTTSSLPQRSTTKTASQLLRLPQTSTSAFSTSSHLQKRAQISHGYDVRVRNIRYHLFHPELPRPLRFSRLRALRHWTIHRAWMVFKHKQRTERERELEKQYNSIHRACEELRLMDENGLRVSEQEAQERRARGDKNVGRLYRIAMEKKRVWGPGKGFPIEYARLQTDYPSREGWNHGWTR